MGRPLPSEGAWRVICHPVCSDWRAVEGKHREAFWQMPSPPPQPLSEIYYEWKISGSPGNLKGPDALHVESFTMFDA